jgi:fructose-1,6-bisphosphatase/inositol monophosphatase family enzyme
MGKNFCPGPLRGFYWCCWLIDPSDGTPSFVSGVLLDANLHALLNGDSALLGIIHLPALDETVSKKQEAHILTPVL